MTSGGTLVESLSPDLWSEWPNNSRFFDPLTMDAANIRALTIDDTEYAEAKWPHAQCPWYLACVYFAESSSKCLKREYLAENQFDPASFSADVAESPVTVIYIRQKRRYYPQGTRSLKSVDRGTWLRVLQHFDVLPSFVELVHSNNGGTLCQTTHGNESNTSDKPSAFHVGYKKADCADEETTIYARQDFGTGRIFVLLLGTKGCIHIDKVHRVLSEGCGRAGIFHVVHAVQSTTLDLTEYVRWSIDYTTLGLEGRTGFAALRYPQQPQEPEQWTFNKDLQTTTDLARCMAWGSSQIRGLFETLGRDLVHFRSVARAAGIACPELNNDIFEGLSGSIRLKIELAGAQLEQIGHLQARLAAQIDVTKTLMAQRDTQFTIEIAKATRRDSELMRGIAAVTMVFLPATFVATFFSMVFFHVGDEQSIRLMVDDRIWLYPVVALPLTIIIGAWYSAWSVGLSRTKVFELLTKRGEKRPEVENGSHEPK